ncbi:hypothetical protein D3C81_1970990 [compost metagenome]
MADVYESHRAVDYAGYLLQLHHADHTGIPGVYWPVRDNRRRTNLLHLPVLPVHLRHGLQVL